MFNNIPVKSTTINVVVVNTLYKHQAHNFKYRRYDMTCVNIDVSVKWVIELKMTQS